MNYPDAPNHIAPKLILDRIAALRKRGIIGSPKAKQAFLDAAATALEPLGAFQKPVKKVE